MRTKTPTSGGVNTCDAKSRRKKHREKSGFGGLCLTDGVRRIRGYLLGCFSQGKEYHDWDKHRFHRCTQSLNPLSIRHIERVVGFYRRTCTEFIWSEFRDGRSTRLRIVPVQPEHAPITIPEVRRRLVGYIRAAIAKNGAAHVDQEFLRQFQRASGLPPELLHLVWAKTRKMAGYRVRWRGVNAGRKMVVTGSSSPTHFAPRPYSTDFVSEWKNTKTGASPLGGSSALRAPVTADRETSPRLPPQQPEISNRADPPAKPPNRWGGKWPLMFVCGRPVSGEKLARLAAVLALTAMRAPHEKWFRVRWRFAHARNFAYRGLMDGFDTAEIVAAWDSAVWRSHEDSLDRDRAVSEDGEWRGELQREPSAAVVYATVKLRENDDRTREERWAAIFARGPRTQPPVPKSDVEKIPPRPSVSDPDGGAADAVTSRSTTKLEKSRPPAPETARSDRQPRPRKTADELRAMLDEHGFGAAGSTRAENDTGSNSELTAGELARYLREKKSMTLAQFNGLSWPFKQALVRGALAWLRENHGPG